jgi:hypothetical protein
MKLSFIASSALDVEDMARVVVDLIIASACRVDDFKD